jgi:hypothetical protein
MSESRKLVMLALAEGMRRIPRKTSSANAGSPRGFRTKPGTEERLR